MTSVEQLKDAAGQEIDRLEERIWSLCKRIHGNPELAFEEHQAAELVASELEDLGFTVERGVAGLPTAFKAWADGQAGGPVIAVQAEYDALPEIGHACGHNLIAATAFGCAAGVKAVLGELPGRIVVLGTPAEERMGGKIIMLDRGAYDEVDAVLYVHAQTRFAAMGGNMAHGSVSVRFKGVPASPSGGKAPEGQEHLGASAVAGLIALFNNVNTMRQHFQRDVIVRGVITNGGSKVEPVPLSAEAWFSFRGPRHTELREVLRKLENCARAAALSTGTEVEIQPEPLYEERFLNRPLQVAIRDNMRRSGVAEVREDGIAASSTDSGNVNQVIPLSGAFIAIADPGTTPHSRGFTEAAGSERARTAMSIGAKTLAWSAIDLMTQSDLLSEVKEDFRARTGREPGRRSAALVG